MKKRLEAWLYSLGASVIGGVATTGSAWMGLAMGKSVGLDLPVLNWKALGTILLCSSLSNLFFFLAKSPLPKMSEGNTDVINKTDVEPKP